MIRVDKPIRGVRSQQFDLLVVRHFGRVCLCLCQRRLTVARSCVPPSKVIADRAYMELLCHARLFVLMLQAASGSLSLSAPPNMLFIPGTWILGSSSRRISRDFVVFRRFQNAVQLRTSLTKPPETPTPHITLEKADPLLVSAHVGVSSQPSYPGFDQGVSLHAVPVCPSILVLGNICLCEQPTRTPHITYPLFQQWLPSPTFCGLPPRTLPRQRLACLYRAQHPLLQAWSERQVWDPRWRARARKRMMTRESNRAVRAVGTAVRM